MSRVQRETPVERISVTAESVRDALADLGTSASYGGRLPKANSASIHAVAEAIVGHDPSQGRSTPDFGGKSKDGYFNEWLSMAALRRAMRELVESGAAVEVDAEDPAISPNYRSKGKQYLLKEAYDESVYMQSMEQQEKQRAAATKAAREEVLRRHADEVSAEIARLCQEAGIPPEEPAEILALRTTKGRI